MEGVLQSSTFISTVSNRVTPQCLTAAADQQIHFISVCRLISVFEQTNNSGVVCKTSEVSQTSLLSFSLCRERSGVEKGHTLGRGACADGSCAGEDAPQHHLLLPVTEDFT